MKIKESFINLVNKIFFNSKWRCLSCGKEIFNEQYFCDDCKEKLPYIKGYTCNHCGRITKAPTEYCFTCAKNLTAIEKGRSVFNYSSPVSNLLVKAKYEGGKYIYDAFITDLTNIYIQNHFNAEIITFVPMTEKALKKRGYNQSQILAEGLAKNTDLKVYYGVQKVKETVNQAKLDRIDRLKNLKSCYRLKNKKEIKGKSVLIVDDVTTTGSTAEALAEKLKKAEAKCVYLLTVASVSLQDNY